MTSTVTEPVLSTDPPTDDVVADESAQQVPADEVLAELLVEEISIDGMCGVY